MVADFVQDLEDFPIPEIDQALQAYRRDPASKFFPTPGAIRAIILDGRKERAALERRGPSLGKVESRPLMWWTQSKRFWKPHWREEDIPRDHQAQYYVIKAKLAETGVAA